MAADHAYLHFEVKDACTRDEYAKQDSGLAKYQFIWEIVDVFSYGIHNGILELDPFTPLNKVNTRIIEVTLHKAVTTPFPTEQAMNPN